MRKVLVANVSSNVANGDKRNIEFELTELNQHLTDGWEIHKSEIVTNQSNSTFSIIYQLVK